MDRVELESVEVLGLFLHCPFPQLHFFLAKIGRLSSSRKRMGKKVETKNPSFRQTRKKKRRKSSFRRSL